MHKLFINRAKGAKVEPDKVHKKKWSQIPQACILSACCNQQEAGLKSVKWENMKHVVIIPGQNW